jgi:hypothetical protein
MVLLREWSVGCGDHVLEVCVLLEDRRVFSRAPLLSFERHCLLVSRALTLKWEGACNTVCPDFEIAIRDALYHDLGCLSVC